MKRRFSLAALLALACLAPLAVQAAYPERSITMLVPFAPGPTDTVGRAIAAAMEKTLGQPIVVENKPSAGGILAPSEVARATPDGYKILIHHIGMATTPALYRKLAFNPLNDFEYIGLINSVPMTIIARPNFPAKNLSEMVNYVKANSQKINLAHAGLGAASHLCDLMFQAAINTPLTTVPYKGTGPALTDLMGGQTDIMCDQTTNTIPQIIGGKVKAYATTTEQRLAQIKDVPTANEAGLKGFELGIWHGLYAPKGTPPEIVAKLNAALKAGLKDEGFRKRMADLGSTVYPEAMQSPAAHKKLVEAETEKWGKLIRAKGEFAD